MVYIFATDATKAHYVLLTSVSDANVEGRGPDLEVAVHHAEDEAANDG